MEYQLPRLTKMWTHLERQSGGGQVKGMGEKQKEVDKRILRDQVSIQHYLIIVKVICMATKISLI
jgi:GTP-binding protein HflX